MGDMGDDFRAMTAYKKEKRAGRLESAIDVLENCGVEHTWLTNYQVRFHVEGKPRVDLYPSSARWVFKYEGKSKTTTYFGDINQFLAWYKKQQVGADNTSVKPKGAGNAKHNT